LTVDQNIRFYAGLYGLSGERLAQRRDFILQMAGLINREDLQARTLSGGWRQRLALGCALLHEPPILFLDEPTGGVDPVSRRDFWRLIDDLAIGGTTVLVTTHYLDEAERCDRVAIIHGGRIAALGPTRELKEALAHSTRTPASSEAGSLDPAKARDPEVLPTLEDVFIDVVTRAEERGAA
jgi:ABC-2 type transport system ATP-binding protein